MNTVFKLTMIFSLITSALHFQMPHADEPKPGVRMLLECSGSRHVRDGVIRVYLDDSGKTARWITTETDQFGRTDTLEISALDFQQKKIPLVSKNGYERHIEKNEYPWGSYWTLHNKDECSEGFASLVCIEHALN